MANYWADKGWHVNLLTLDDGREPPFYDLHPAIVYRPLGIVDNSSGPIQGVVNNLKRIRVLRQAIKESTPQAVISFMDRMNVLTLLATFGLNLPVIVSERINPAYHSIGKVWNFLRRLLYPHTSCLVVQTQDALAYFSAAVQRHARVIPNPVILSYDSETNTKEYFNLTGKTVMAMGRLCEQKGFDLLLKAFATISVQHPDWSLVIWGEGPLRTSLESLRDELGLQGRVHFPGRTHQPFEKMREADLFVLSSRYEGFPNALCEAMACGLPVVSFDCPSGPREIIRDGVDGALVPPEDVNSLAAAMDRLMSDKVERNRLASRAVEVIERFGLEKMMGMWESALGYVLERRRT